MPTVIGETSKTAQEALQRARTQIQRAETGDLGRRLLALVTRLDREIALGVERHRALRKVGRPDPKQPTVGYNDLRMHDDRRLVARFVHRGIANTQPSETVGLSNPPHLPVP